MNASNSLTTNKDRNSNIELLRLIAIAGVVFLHYFNAGIGGAIKYVAKGSLSEFVLMLLEAINICAVDLFVMISGLFLSKRNNRYVGNVLALLLQTSLFRVSYYLVRCLIKGSSITFKTVLVMLLPSNWFVILYSAMYLVSPLINRVSEPGQKKRALIITLIVFSAWPTFVDLLQFILDVDLNSLSSISMYGSERGYTITNFFLCYLTGSFLSSVELDKIRIKYLLLFLALNTALLTLWSYWHASSAREYCNPLVIANAAAVLILSLKIDLGQSSVINRISSATFSVFLLHQWLFPLMDIEKYVKSSTLTMIIHIAVTITVILFISFLIDLVYKLLLGRVLNKLKKSFRFEL